MKSALDQKQKALEAEEKRQKLSEELLKKEQAEWKDVNTKRQSLLEADLQSKISIYADKETEYVQKWEDLKQRESSLAEDRSAETQKIDALKQEAEAEYLKVQTARKEL